MTLTPTTRQASAAVVFAAVLWGLYWIPLRHLDAMGIAGPLATALLNAPVAVLTGLWLARNWRQERAHLGPAVLIGLSSGSGLAFFSLAVFETTVIRATLLFYLMPVWGTVIGIVWLGERPGWPRWAGLAAGVAGLSLLIAGAPDGGAWGLGDTLALAAGFGWAVAAAILKRRGAVPVAGMLTAQFVMVTLVALGVGAMLAPIELPGVSTLTPALPLALAVAVFGLLPATVAIFWAGQFLFPGRVGLLLLAEVAVAVISARLLLPEETLTGLQWAAVTLILAAGILEVAPGARRAKRTPA